MMRSSGSRSLEDPCNLGELQLTGLECCQGSNFAGVRCLALDVTGLDDQVLIGFGKIRPGSWQAATASPLMNAIAVGPAS